MGLFLYFRRLKMPFKKFVEIGRVAVLNGETADKGKIAAIVNVIDQNRVLIDGPDNITRQAYRIKDLHLTPLVTKFPFNAKKKIVKKSWEADQITKKWEESAWAKRMAMKNKRATLTDFDRFKLQKAKHARNHILRKAVAIKKKKMQKAGKL